ncbi:trithorax group protein osa-like [Salvia splendens]|uniref:trithorax group protein osa-like n=1 Tax=Salvia splendens TaxID=180675 RepID=UPI001C27127D|nr:trithorax group protein osa-like [Salvia splendens]
MVSEQETKKQPPMEVSQIHTLKLLIETIANLIDLYKSNTNQSQNSYPLKNLGVGSKRTAATSTQANNRSRNISLPPNGNHIESAHKDKLPKPKKTYANALVDGGSSNTGRQLHPSNSEAAAAAEGATAAEGAASAAEAAEGAAAAAAEGATAAEGAAAVAEAAEGAASVGEAAEGAASAAEALQRRRRKKQGMCRILAGGYQDGNDRWAWH